MARSASFDERASAIREAAEARMARVRADDSLSPVGRQRAIGPIYLGARQQMQQLVDEQKAARTAREVELKRAAFGVASSDPVHVMSHRDAVGRASEITDVADASYQLQRALRDGDSVMAKALASHAMDNGWLHVVEDYTAARPEFGEALAEIATLQPTVNDTFWQGLLTIVPTPGEFGHMADTQIEAMIAEPTTQAAG